MSRIYLFFLFFFFPKHTLEYIVCYKLHKNKTSAYICIRIFIILATFCFDSGVLNVYFVAVRDRFLNDVLRKKIKPKVGKGQR